MTLIDRINALKFKFLLQSGVDASLLLVPKDRAEIKRFSQALVDELGADETGPATHVFHFLMTGERQMSVCGLEVSVTSATTELAVGNPLH